MPSYNGISILVPLGTVLANPFTNIKPMLDLQIVCLVYMLADTTEDKIDDCVVPLFGKKFMQYDIHTSVQCFCICPLFNQYKHLFRTCPGNTYNYGLAFYSYNRYSC